MLFSSKARRLARKILFPPIEWLWEACFAVAGAISQPSMRRFTPGENDRILVLAPHPDDETIDCGGTIALHALAGNSVSICIVTDGSQSKGASLMPEQTRIQRSLEARDAVERLGNVELLQLGLVEGSWRESDFSTQLTRICDHIKPTIIYTTSPVDFHPEHIRVAHALARIIRLGNFPNLNAVRLYELNVPLTPMLANMVVDIDKVSANKAQALREYTTQQPSFVWMSRYNRYQQRLYRSRNTVEVFCELTPNQFVSLSDEASTRPATYRGLRPRPITDPATWFIGRKQRKRLRQLMSRT